MGRHNVGQHCLGHPLLVPARGADLSSRGYKRVGIVRFGWEERAVQAMIWGMFTQRGGFELLRFAVKHPKPVDDAHVRVEVRGLRSLQ